MHKLNDGGDPNAHIFDTHKLKTLLSKVMHREESQCLTNKQCDSPSSSGRDLKISKNICSTFKKRGSSSFTVQNKPVVKSIEFNSLTLKDVMIQRLHAARFRYINERFYKTTSTVIGFLKSYNIK